VGVHAIPGNGKVEVVWEPPQWHGGANVHSYRVYRGLEPDKLKVVNVVPASITTFTDTNVGNGYKFYYAVQAMNSIGGGEMSRMISAIPFGPPTWPTTINVEPGLNRLILTWTPPKDDGGYPVKEYEIYRGTARMLVESLVVVDGSETKYVDTDVKVGVIYYYRMIVQTGVASSSPSWVVAGSPFGSPTIPTGITIIPFLDRVLVSWGTPVHDGGFLLAGYHIYTREDVPGINWTRKATVKEGTNHMLRGLANGRTYVFKVTAFNDVAEGPGIETKLTIIGRPEPPLDLKAFVVYGDVYLEWSPPASDGGSPITAYEIRRSDDAGATYLLGRIGGETSYVDEFPEPGRRYRYTVTAVNILEESEPSEPVTAQVPEGARPEFIPRSWTGLIVLVAVAVTLSVGYIVYRRRDADEGGPPVGWKEWLHSRMVSLLRR
jgi:fibronectin type 3 domain-containing protein